ncbi:hypothetical protein HNQ80_004113 [Anaerosolibacter carboniphilus]|uniref:Motility protein n=1 Tax=Anaerosolibacter carboniphilus TaxID=1417629 RepID=A0A841KWB0_9FIRM|nr:putative motility protein [Anaerosolibacter carboniphilus]MBB6217976.1 hypothetical protein [Anaerosolibacter carboniphilus]
MNISGYAAQNTYSIKQALNMSILQKAMNQDATAVSMLVEAMQNASRSMMENSVTPNKGGNIDISV